MRTPTALLAAVALFVSACSSTTETSDSLPTTTPPSATTLASTTSPAPPTTGELPLPTTSATSLPAVAGTSLVDVMASVQDDLDFMWSLNDPEPGLVGPVTIACDNPQAVPARLGNVFACPGVPQTDGTLILDEVGVVMMVVADDGTARWLAGIDLPSDLGSLKALHAPQAGAHFCRELQSEAGHPFDLGYLGAVLYWFLDGMPERMDADRDGVPCETVFPYEEVLEVWGGTDQEALLSDPRDAYQFAFVTEIAPDGSTVTLDYADFLTGPEADEAAVAAGEIPEGEHIDNDYYIRNRNPLLRTLSIDPAAGIDLIGFYFEGDQLLDGIPVTPAEWAALLIEAERCVAEDFPPECENLGGDGWVWYGGGYLPYWVLIKGDVVVAVSEQYLP